MGLSESVVLVLSEVLDVVPSNRIFVFISRILGSGGLHLERKFVGQMESHCRTDSLMNSSPHQTSLEQYHLPKGWSVGRSASVFHSKTFRCPNDSYIVDIETWNSIDGDLVFAKIDRSSSFVGSQLLYQRLRQPRLRNNSLERMELLINALNAEPECISQVSSILLQLREVDGWDAHKLLRESPEALPFAPWVLVIATISAFLALACAVVFGSWFWGIALACFGINTWIHFKVNLHASSSMNSIFALRKIVHVGQALHGITRIASELEASGFKTALSLTSKFAKGGFLLDFNDPTGALDYLKICTLYDARFFTSKIRHLESRRQALKKIFLGIGQVDNCLSIARMRDELQINLSLPDHHNSESFTFEECSHPLLDQKSAIANSIKIEKPGVILTGLNMAGKSTFLKSIAINVLLSQTVNTVFCRRYCGPFCKIFAVMKSEDTLSEGKSHFMQELTSIQRLVDATSEQYPCLLIVDEMFRGTNSDERIAASSAVVTYLGSKKTTIVATHDLEVISLVPDSFKKFIFSGLVEIDGVLRFDFILRQGVCKERNAIRLLKSLSYPTEIVVAAENFFDRFNTGAPR